MIKQRQKRKKYMSKYRRKYGCSVKEASELLGWSYGTVYAYFQDSVKQKEMLSLISLEGDALAEDDAVSEDDYKSQNPIEPLNE